MSDITGDDGEIAYGDNDWTEKELAQLKARLWMDMLLPLSEKISILLLNMFRDEQKDGV